MEKRASDMDDSHLIKITHYINPHTFWFKYESSFLNNRKLFDLESELQRHFFDEARTSKLHYKPEIDEMVAVFHCSFNRWIRAKCDFISDFMISQTKYTLWAVDYGIPFQTESRWIRELPKQLQNRPQDSVFFGGIINVVPAEKAFNYDSYKDVIRDCDSWSPLAVRIIEDLINDAAQTTFITEKDFIRNNEHQYFGKLVCTTHTNKTVGADVILVELNQAKISEDFFIALRRIGTNRIPRWRTNDGNTYVSKHMVNKPDAKLRSISPANKLEIIDRCRDMEIEKKVTDWDQKNQQSYIKEQIIIEDITLSDSASVLVKTHPVGRIVKNIEVERDDDQFMKNGGIPRRKVLEKYEKKIPRAPIEDNRELKSQSSKNEEGKNDEKEPELRCAEKNEIAIENEVVASLNRSNGDANKTSSDRSSASVNCTGNADAVNFASSRMKKRRPKISSKPEKPSSQVPQNAIPAGFDLRNLLNSKQETNNKPRTSRSSEDNIAPHAFPSFGYGKNKTSTNLSPMNNVEEQWQNTVSKHLLALVHGNIAKPIDNLGSANFCDEIHRELEYMRFTIYRIQSFTWPHLMRGNSLVVVNSARTGKTMSYLPAICSLIKMKSDEDLVPDTVGPIGIIVAPSAVEVERIARLCRRFFGSSTTKMSIVESYGIRNTDKTTKLLLNGCEILVSTPPSLTRLFSHKLKLFDNKRIEHLVLDNIDFIHEKMKSELHQILQKCCGLSKLKATTPVQLVVTAKYWNPILSGLLKLCHNPQLCIGAYIEAAVYARSSIIVKFMKGKSKVHAIADFIKTHTYLSERLIIICNKDEEVDDVVSALKCLSCFFMSCNSRSSATEIDLIRGWHQHPCGDMSILVCTDQLLPELQVRSAQNIIHYSLPLSWTKFSFRFSSLFEYFEDFVKSDVEHKAKAHCLILLDENNNDQLPRLIQFLQTHNKAENISREIYALCNKIKVRREEERKAENKEFCPFYMEFGKCVNIDNCKFRHVLTKFDLPEKIPCDGLIKFEVLHISSPTLYTVRLLEHKPHNNKNWEKIKNSSDYAIFNLRFSLYFLNIDHHQTHWPIEVNDMCVVIHMNKYYRCRVLTVTKSKSVASDANVSVKLVDVGEEIMCKSSKILMLPKQFEEYPHQAVNVRLLGIVPCDHEEEWDSSAIRNVKHWFNSKKDTMYIKARIKFSLMDTIWVDNIYLTERLPTIDTYVDVINIKRALLEKKFASVSGEAEEIIRQMATECGILKNVDSASPVNTNVPYKEEEHMAEDNLVYREKSLSESGSSVSNLSFSDKVRKTINYKTKNTTNIAICNGKGSNVKNSSISSTQSKEKKILNNASSVKNKTKTELWENLIENRFCEVSVGTFYTPNNFYVQHINNLERLDLLYKKIDRFVENNPRSVNNPKIGLNCLAKYDDKYNRAKITKVLCDGERNELNVSVFFCDIGISENISLSEVLHSSPSLVNSVPFQAIRCKLVGIIPNTYGIWTNETSDRIYDEIIDKAHSIYARPIKFEEPSNQSDLQYWKCDVVLVDCSTEQDIKINRKIVEAGLAQYDPASKHFLDILVNIEPDNVTDDNSSDSDWDDCNYVRPEIPKVEKTPDLYDFDFEKMDIQFSESDVIRILNLPPNSRILPPEPKKPIKSDPKINEIVEEVEENKPINRILNCKTNKIGENDQYAAMPRLKSLLKYPPVVWQQAESLIILKISAPDVADNYFLKVTSTSLIFIAKIENETQMLGLNFFGAINANLVSHEIRGLNVIVRLSKAIKGLPWPRLAFESDNLRWLKYNNEQIRFGQQTLKDAASLAFESDKLGRLTYNSEQIGFGQRTLKDAARFSVNYVDDSSDELSDSGEHNYDRQTRDAFDPLDDEF